jgi:hypothetical protein
MVGSYGATMVLVFAAPAGPFSQPRNVIGGNIIASFVAVGCRVWIAEPMGNYVFALPFAVAFSYVLMHITRTLNPPAGGTAALVVISTPAIDHIGWGLVVPAVLWGVVFVLVACIFINMVPGHRYPRYWFVEHSVYTAVSEKCCASCGRPQPIPTLPGNEPPKEERKEQEKESIKRKFSEPCEIHGTSSTKHQPSNPSVPNRDDEGNLIGEQEEDVVESWIPETVTRSLQSLESMVPGVSSEAHAMHGFDMTVPPLSDGSSRTDSNARIPDGTSNNTIAMV